MAVKLRVHVPEHVKMAAVPRGVGNTFLDPPIIFLRLQGPSGSATLTSRNAYKRMSSIDTTPETNSKICIVTRNQQIVPRERRIERLPTGYSIQECRNDSRGHYWFVITALELLSRSART